MKQFLLSDADKRNAITFRRDMHAHPELSMQEYETTKKIKKQLTEWGIRLADVELETGVIALIGQGKSDKVIALRADIDALPITEASGLSFHSVESGKGHCCGHDLHTTAMLYAAKMLKAAEADIDGLILIIFQPGEESLHGSQSIIKSGVFDKYKPEFIVGLHTWPEVPAGSIGVKKGFFMAASDRLTLTVKGKGGHGAHPHKSVDPVCITGYILTALQSIVSRNIAPLDSAVVTIGKIQGGTAGNVIPDQVIMEGTVRTLSPAVRELVQQRLETLLPSIAAGFGGECIVEYKKGTPPVVNNDAIVDSIEKAASETIGTDSIVQLASASMGSEDFAEYLSLMPGALFRIGTGNDDERTHRALHNSGIVFDEKGIFAGAQVMAQFAWDAFQK